MKQLTQKHIDEILTKQFEMVGQTYHPDIVKEEKWYLRHYWTKKQEDEFRKWLTNYLLSSKLTTKRMVEKEVDYFLLYCGWPLEEFRVSS